MLRKLIKYEWKSTYKVGSLMLITSLVIGLLGAITVRFAFHDDMENELASSVFPILGFFTLLLFFLLLVSIVYGNLIYQGVKFYKSMYCDEGYLSHTLPVTTHQLLLSKIFVSGIWVLLIAVSLFVAGFMFVGSLISASGADMSLWEVIREIFRHLPELKEEFGISITPYVIWFILTVFVGPFISMASLFGAITMGQIVNKHRGLMAFVFYLLYMVVNWICQMITGMPFEYAKYNSLNSGYDDSFFGTFSGANVGKCFTQLAVNFVLAMIMYAIAYHINEKKLNLE